MLCTHFHLWHSRQLLWKSTSAKNGTEIKDVQGKIYWFWSSFRDFFFESPKVLVVIVQELISFIHHQIRSNCSEWLKEHRKSLSKVAVLLRHFRKSIPDNLHRQYIHTFIQYQGPWGKPTRDRQTKYQIQVSTSFMLPTFTVFKLPSPAAIINAVNVCRTGNTCMLLQHCWFFQKQVGNQALKLVLLQVINADWFFNLSSPREGQERAQTLHGLPPHLIPSKIDPINATRKRLPIVLTLFLLLFTSNLWQQIFLPDLFHCFYLLDKIELQQ